MSERDSISSASLLVEDYTPSALWTDEPFSTARVTKAERPATDRSGGHYCPIQWATRRFARTCRL